MGREVVIEEEIFNKRIGRFLKEMPNSSASDTIRLILKHQKNNDNYYIAFDNVASYLGIDLIYHSEGKGYIPYIKYYPDNRLGKIPGEEKLLQLPVELKGCYEFRAKKLLYKIMEIPNLEELLKT